MSSAVGKHFVFHCAPSARDFLLAKGPTSKFGARHLKRSIERHLVFPLSSLLATGQIEFGDLVTVDFDPETLEADVPEGEPRRAGEDRNETRIGSRLVGRGKTLWVVKIMSARGISILQTGVFCWSQSCKLAQCPGFWGSRAA